MKIPNLTGSKCKNHYKDLVIMNNTKIMYMKDNAILRQKLIVIKNIGLFLLEMSFIVIDLKVTQTIELCIR